MIGDRLFKKMMVTYMLIIIATLTVLGVLITILLKNYFNYNKRSELIVKGADIAQIVKPTLLQGEDPTDLVAWLNRSDRNLGTEVWVIRPDGAVITASAHQWRHEGNRIANTTIDELQKGHVSVREGQSEFYSEPGIWVTTPVKDQNRVIGGVILFGPVVGITQTLKQTHLLFIYAAIASLLFSAGVGYIFSKSVFTPLEKMNDIAYKIAKGDFSQRMKVSTSDEIGKLAESMNYMADKIEKHECTRQEFLANVSHDLRTPLTSILGFIEALQDNKDKNEDIRRRFLDILHSETSRLIRLVNDLLDFTKMEEGVLDLDCQKVDIPRLIADVLKKYQPLANQKGITVKSKIEREDITIYGDRDRLEQALTNLLDNTFRYAKEEISVKVEQKDNDVKISIADDGPGIPEEDLPNIWERFYKVDKSRSHGQGGTGLGLAIVKKLINTHGGKVDVESALNKGTTFIIELSTKVKK